MCNHIFLLHRSVAGNKLKQKIKQIYGKAFLYFLTLNNLLLRNQKADDLETWYAALSAQVLSNLFK